MVNLLATANGVSYLDENGDEQTADNVTVVESSMTTWNGGWYVVNDTVIIGQPRHRFRRCPPDFGGRCRPHNRERHSSTG